MKLNEMDGIANDAEVIFLLTTNRPDLLEPALAARLCCTASWPTVASSPSGCSGPMAPTSDPAR